MSSLIPMQRAYSRIPQLVVHTVPGFAASPEYTALGKPDLQLPGVVCGAFAKFLVRLQQGVSAGAVRAESAAGLAASYQVVEQLATSDDPEVVNAVVVEIFENLDCEPHVLEAIKARLGKVSRQLYAKWVR
jgi:hypothetical protein